MDYDLVIGADGDHSAVRRCVEDQLETFKTRTAELSLRHVMVQVDAREMPAEYTNKMHQWIDDLDGHVVAVG